MSHFSFKAISRLFTGPPIRNTPARQTATVTATLTTAQIMGEVLRVISGSSTSSLTTPTGTQISAATPGGAIVGDSFDLFLINASTNGGEPVILVMGTDVTLVGNNDIEEEDAITNSSSAHFRFRNTGANTWDCMRLG